MTPPATRLLEIIGRGDAAIWVRVEAVLGSAPREVGASMVVDAHGWVDGTLGGGHLEFDAIGRARRQLANGERLAWRRYRLGPSLGQCCGGAVLLSWRRVDAREHAWVDAMARIEREGGTLWLRSRTDGAEGAHTAALQSPPAGPASPRADLDPALGPQGDAWRHWVSRVDAVPWTVWVFGAGHVGQALVRVLATLPARIVWVDPRGGCIGPGQPPNVVPLESDSPSHEVASIPAGADVLVMTHSHALDFDLCGALLARGDLPWIGLIGSRTKAASFRARLARRGIAAAQIARLHCPVGTPVPGPEGRGVIDRHPGAIALSIALDAWGRRRTALAAAVPAAGTALPAALPGVGR